ncbi:UDP-N-acetylmuramate dehydrogenase [Vibrio ziniensis]|uniref:UDP-N-acetylenolpyruvoylglucosamine reductase n=1 Tax=Vibrio ziniensis TaxID=2711221 RepID=A0A6G7CLK1_9VIBR|nr:UDP-N-acetylmuramate dehydrogenase [Vibrio ziniensis]QIH42926.1 UDP-N-acetylmuramate dehydrogenase [Vibrio ziniensis]
MQLHSPLQIHHDANLAPYHTFGIEQVCHSLVNVETVDDLKDVYRSKELQTLPKLMLGKGSNILFTETYQGLVMVNRMLGIQHTQDEMFHYLHVEGGEDWPELVAWSISQNISGLENLALIPGCAGSAPIQNIGAYGLEFQDVCEYVDYLCLESLEVKRLTKEQCVFGYRNSIFKNELYGKAIVVAVGLKLTKDWQPNIHYGPLKELGDNCTARQIFERVSQIRTEKLPDPAVIGNAGSFFKNPVVVEQHFEMLKAFFPDIVAYPVEEGMKLAAGWLIEHAGLKGKVHGGAQVHPNQALVLINKSNATAQDVVELAGIVRNKVLETYGVLLEHEVRFMGRDRETYLTTLMGDL